MSGHAGPWDALQILLYDDQEFSWPAVYDVRDQSLPLPAAPRRLEPDLSVGRCAQEGLRPDVKCGERDMVHSYHPQHGGHRAAVATTTEPPRRRHHHR